ncbi:DUF3747 domain-containing protein [Thermoleptolyngbya sichuanensis XZ-Cy5]|uniref:DUF3747 domain-containing protein n=1 Tax=Thermoleptolyngbya sichuanensis TaxID=2885951 RepID=UPI00240D1EE2|nr:DUF3747 domain-containing protein [Thermoleptolyngbya sichuanensis]MDG2615189.1 DUF3747 domain-containing protein [Thermoleptolyngbya sichuanensis XZ-Cy5]
MERPHWLSLTALTALSLGMGGLNEQAIATTFNNTQVDQSRFVVLGSAGGSRITILEQVSNARACWQESSNGTVDALMTRFDFTGICARATDRNGYSVRVGGQDLGLQYTLRTVTQGNQIILYAQPSSGSGTLEIGRSRSAASGFNRIQLNPGWYLSRRTFNGQPLGHLYLTNDLSLAALTSASRPIATNPAPVAPRPTTPAPPPAPIVVTPAPQPSRPVGSAPVEIPVPPPASGVVVTRPTPAPAPSTGSPTIVNGIPLPPPPPSVSAPESVAVLPVPSLPPMPLGQTPPGQVGSARPPVFTGAPQPASPLASSLGFSFRVVVNGSSPDVQTRVRSIAPDAFRTVINGQVVMQAGLFRDRATADQMLQRLSSANLQAAVVPVN